jgi:hypothetical protein
MSICRNPIGGRLLAGVALLVGIVQATIAQSPPEAASPASFTPPAAGRDAAPIKTVDDTTAPNERSPDVGMLEQLARQRGGRPEALAQFIQLTRDLDDVKTATLIEELAEAHRHAGAVDLAAEARRALAERFPTLAQGRDALIWLVRLYASSETAYARRRPSSAAAALRQQLPPQAAARLKRAPSHTDAAGEGEPDETSADPMALYAFHLASQAIAAQPALAEEPALAFQRSVAARRAGQPKAAQALLSTLKRRRAGDPWGDSARAEAWLVEPSDSPCPKPIMSCPRAAGRPHLDARLDDECWQHTAGHPIGEAPATTVNFAYDREFLYVAAQCAKLPDVIYAADGRPRPHDGDVDQFDRVTLRLDVDRDFATWFELVADCRGWTAESCWGDAAWNPQWFVAANCSGDWWTVEAAIPFASLVARPPEPGEAWACAVSRIRPSGEPPAPDAGKTSPEAFCLLRFD